MARNHAQVRAKTPILWATRSLIWGPASFQKVEPLMVEPHPAGPHLIRRSAKVLRKTILFLAR